MRDIRNCWQWAEWRMPRPGSKTARFAAVEVRSIAIDPVLVPPNADRDARFQVQFLQDMLHVFLHRAGAALQNLSDLGIALSRRDPFDHFELALGQRTRPSGREVFQPRFYGLAALKAVPGGHGGRL